MRNSTEEMLLYKTHYGLTIYAYVLRQHFGEATVLSLSGNKCAPIENPFRAGGSLQISLKGKQFVYEDLTDPAYSGTPFEFAAQHFELEGQELLQKINEVMSLELKGKEVPTEKQREGRRIFKPMFSYFKKPVANTIPYREVSMVDVFRVIRGKYFAKPTLKLRAIKDSKLARAFKARAFDYVTFSGTFLRRSDKALIAHSGLAVLDFDKVGNISGLKKKLLCDPYFETQLLFTSPSGNGLKWVIPIDQTEGAHKYYLEGVMNYVEATYQTPVDPAGKDVSRSCFLSYDNEAYVNPKYFVR